jgi:hypothetical protein
VVQEIGPVRRRVVLNTSGLILVSMFDIQTGSGAKNIIFVMLFLLCAAVGLLRRAFGPKQPERECPAWMGTPEGRRKRLKRVAVVFGVLALAGIVFVLLSGALRGGPGE